MQNRFIICVKIMCVLLITTTSRAYASDPENCLSCHRYRGLGRVEEDGKTVRLFHVDADYYDRALGPHARLRCTDCHARDEVSVIPHQPVTAVNCTTACHLAPTGQMEVNFSHQQIAEMLEQSVHTREVLEKSNQLMGSPLRTDQSRCLLCHDEPSFSRSGESWAQREAPIARCQVCHTEELPMQMDPQFMFWHVHARSRPARSNADVVRVCATCHSNTKVREAFELPDTIASYLASFHGKAMQLGSEETAGCLDCHVGPMQNVHVMQSHLQGGAPTSDPKLPDTCRSNACHPTAGHGVSTAAVHLELSTSRGVEYFIAAVFVLMIMSTFGPSVVLQALELLQIVIGRHDTEHHHRHLLAKRLTADSRGRKALSRFTPHQRVQHWILALAFTTLVLTGFPIKFASDRWARWVIDLFGGLSVARMIHRWAGVLLIVGFAYHFAYVVYSAWRDKRRNGRGWIQTILSLPMMTNARDLKELSQLLAYLLFLRRTRPALGRFSLKEKFEYFGVFWGSALLGITGILMWANSWTTLHLTGRVLTVASLIHTFEAFLALLHVGIIHMIGVIFAPAVFPVSKAMFTGETPTEELAESHAGMLADVAQQIGAVPKEATHG